MALMKDKYGRDVEYDDLIKIDGVENEMVLREAIDIHMIEIMKFQGYLHFFESEIELVDKYDEAIKKFPELYL